MNLKQNFSNLPKHFLCKPYMENIHQYIGRITITIKMFYLIYKNKKARHVLYFRSNI